MMLIVVDSSVKGDVEVLLRRSGVSGYTELAPGVGWGETGLRLGSGAFPGTTSVLFTVLDSSAEERVRIALAGFEEGATRRVRGYAWSVEEVA